MTNGATAIRRQYFCSFGIIGSVMPLMSVFLWKEAQFSLLQVGFAMSLMSVPMLCTPGLITLLADRNVDARRILAVAFSVSACVLSSIYFSTSLALTMTLFVFHGLAFVAMLPLQDGFYFSWAEQRRNETNEEPPPYPTFRIWGTIGFILPSLILYFVIRSGATSASILLVAVGFCLCSIANSFTLPELKKGIVVKGSRLPTTEALAKLFSPEARFLCIGLMFAFLATTAFYSFIAVYYLEVIGIQSEWIGLVTNTGVVLEILWTLAVPWLQRHLGLRGIIIAGLSSMVIRLILLALFPSVAIALLTQLTHGLEVVALFIAPIMFIDRLAGDRFRNSIQGVFTMAVSGTSRIVGALVAGIVASVYGLETMLWYGSGMALIGVVIIAVFFQRIPPKPEQPPSGT